VYPTPYKASKLDKSTAEDWPAATQGMGTLDDGIFVTAPANECSP